MNNIDNDCAIPNKFNNSSDSKIYRKCSICKSSTTKRCSKCKIVYYCSIGCQKKSWKDHRKICCSNSSIKYLNLYNKLTESFEEELEICSEEDKMKTYQIINKLLSDKKPEAKKKPKPVCFQCSEYFTQENYHCKQCNKNYLFCSTLCTRLHRNKHDSEKIDSDMEQHGVSRVGILHNYIKRNLCGYRPDIYYIVKTLESKLNKYITRLSDDEYDIYFDEKIKNIDDIYIKDQNGKTLTEVAADYGYWRTLLFLLKSGADPCYIGNNDHNLGYFSATKIPNNSNFIRSYSTNDDYRGKIDCLQILFSHGCTLDQELIFSICSEPYPYNITDYILCLLTSTLKNRAMIPSYVRNFNYTKLNEDMLCIISKYIDENLLFNIPEHIVCTGISRLKKSLNLSPNINTFRRKIFADEKLKRLLKCFIECYIHKYENNNKEKLLGYLGYRYEFFNNVYLKEYLELREDEYGKYLWELVKKVRDAINE